MTRESTVIVKCTLCTVFEPQFTRLPPQGGLMLPKVGTVRRAARALLFLESDRISCFRCSRTHFVDFVYH